MSPPIASPAAAAAEVMVEDLAEEPSSTAALCLAVVPFGRGRAKAKSKACALREKYLSGFQGKSTEECLAAMKERYEAEEACIQRVSEAESLRAADVDEVRREVEARRQRVAEAMEVELEAARAFREQKAKRVQAAQMTEQKWLNLLEVQKKIAMLQVMKLNHSTMQRLKEERLEALKVAQEAKRSIKEHMMNERKALEEATRKAAPSQARIGGKRKACEDSSEHAATEAQLAKQAKVGDTEAEAGSTDQKQEAAKETLVTKQTDGEHAVGIEEASEEALCAAGA